MRAPISESPRKRNSRLASRARATAASDASALTVAMAFGARLEGDDSCPASRIALLCSMGGGVGDVEGDDESERSGEIEGAGDDESERSGEIEGAGDSAVIAAATEAPAAERAHGAEAKAAEATAAGAGRGRRHALQRTARRQPRRRRPRRLDPYSREAAEPACMPAGELGEGGILPGENEPTEFCRQKFCVASRARSIRPMTAESVDGAAAMRRRWTEASLSAERSSRSSRSSLGAGAKAADAADAVGVANSPVGSSFRKPEHPAVRRLSSAR